MRRPLVLLALLAPAASLVVGARAADALGVATAEQLSRLGRLLPRPATPPPAEAEPELTLAATPPPSDGPGQRPAARQRPKPRAVFVSAAQVLAIAQSGARPRGKPVPATARRPAGLRLSGVSALGLGLLDGDVLTEAAGAPALDAGAVIEAVLRARARQLKSVSGTCYRGDERFALVVEQPYLPARNPGSAGSPARP